MARVIEIVKAHLVAGGFDGLVAVDAECGCLCDDLAPCSSDFGGCEPGYRGALKDGEPDEWAIYRTKAAALASVLLARHEPPNVRAKRAATAGRQARAGENVPRTARPGLVACRWRSA